jgi:protein import protein ZIM17
VNGSFSDVPGVQSDGDKYAMMYTCGVCETRAAKMISKQAYHHGTVLIRCPSCQNLHLIADNLNQFEEPGWRLEDVLAAQGERVRTVASEDVLELTLADITGATLSPDHPSSPPS